MSDTNEPLSTALQKMIAHVGSTNQLLNLLYEAIDRAAITYAHKKFAHNKTKIAEFLGISRTTLLKKMKHLNITD